MSQTLALMFEIHLTKYDELMFSTFSCSSASFVVEARPRHVCRSHDMFVSDSLRHDPEFRLVVDAARLNVSIDVSVDAATSRTLSLRRFMMGRKVTALSKELGLDCW